MKRLLVFLLVCYQHVNAQRGYKPKPDIPESDPIDPPSVPGGSGPGPGGELFDVEGGETFYVGDVPLPSSGPVQTQMTYLEHDVKKKAGKEAATLFVEQLASALLGTGHAETKKNVSISTTSMDMVAFAPCIQYASKLSECANATSGFYSERDRGKQAQCICYWTAGEMVGYTAEFDIDASLCRRYLTSAGSYSAIASAMGGSSFIGTSFCDSGIKETSGPSSPGEGASGESHGGTAPLLTLLDKKILVVLSSFVVAVAWLACL